MKRRLTHFALLVGLLTGCGGDRRPMASGPLGPDIRLPVAFELPDTQAQTVALSASEGRVVVVQFFATWDPAAARRLGGLNDLITGEDPLPKDTLVVLGVCVDETQPARLADFREGGQLTIPILIADEAMRKGDTPFGELRAVPTTFLIDRMGRFSERIDGEAPLEYIRRRVDALAQEAG